MSRLILIDGNAILHRAYHALPRLTTKRGEIINAVYGMISMILKVIVDLKPTHIAVAFDRKEPTFRHKEFKQYQAHRPPMEKDLSTQFDKARKVVEVFGIPIYDRVGYEADDVIGSISDKAQKENINEVIIVTGDRDILQLVNKVVKVYLPTKGLSEARVYNINNVIEKMGVKPAQIVDYKALVGDPSDNYQGVNGIGPKTAINLLIKYSNLENIYKNINDIEKPIRNKLILGKENAMISYKLAKIVQNIDMNIDFNKMNLWRVDSDQVLELFSDFGFKTLSKRVREVGKTIVSENQMKLL